MYTSEFNENLCTCFLHKTVFAGLERYNTSAVPTVQESLNISEPPTSAEILTELDSNADDNSESDDSSDESEEYHSFDSDSESEASLEHPTEEERAQEHEAREAEKQRVLEAAGLIVKKDQGARPPRPPRRRSVRKRRAPPSAPSKASTSQTRFEDKELPETPEASFTPATETVLHIDDAFERYEAYLKNKDNRTSMASTISSPPSTPAPSLSIKTNVSQDSENKVYSHLMNFLGRKTPVQEEKPRLQISAPMSLAREGSKQDDSTGAQFGTVRSGASVYSILV